MGHAYQTTCCQVGIVQRLLNIHILFNITESRVEVEGQILIIQFVVQAKLLLRCEHEVVHAILNHLYSVFLLGNDFRLVLNQTVERMVQDA